MVGSTRSRSVVLSASSAFAGVSVALFGGVWAGPGCQSACQGDFDCVGAGYCDQSTGRCKRDCLADSDCRFPPSCRENPSACRPLGLFCSGTGRCLGSIAPELPSDPRPAPAAPPRIPEGWNDPPGTGYAFIVDRLALAEAPLGFDLDGRCDDDGCVDNVLGAFAGLANGHIQNGLPGGETRILIELTGLDDAPYTGADASLTVKVHGAVDADEPPFLQNDFQTPRNHDRCCEFEVRPSSTEARAPAELDRGQLRTLLPMNLRFVLTIGSEPHDTLRVDRALLSARVGSGLASLEDGLIGGAIPITSLYGIANPYCRVAGPRCPRALGASTLLDLVVGLISAEPDIDLDGDGRECLFDVNGDDAVDLCCDGRGPGARCDLDRLTCPGFERPPADPQDPSSCALPAAMDDGYSAALSFGAVRARILGIAY